MQSKLTTKSGFFGMLSKPCQVCPVCCVASVGIVFELSVFVDGVWIVCECVDSVCVDV